MARVKNAVNSKKKRRTTLERASGYRGQRSRLYRKAKEQVTHSMVYNYRDRKVRKNEFRKLWIARINAGARANGMTYNRFMQGLKLAEVEVDRRMLAEIAVSDAAAFTTLVSVAKNALPADVNAPRAAEAPKASKPAASKAAGAGSKENVAVKDEAPANAIKANGSETPEGYIIKGNATSMKYHVPGSTWYEQTEAEFWFSSVDAAKAAGYEPAGGEARQKFEA